MGDGSMTTLTIADPEKEGIRDYLKSLPSRNPEGCTTTRGGKNHARASFVWSWSLRSEPQSDATPTPALTFMFNMYCIGLGVITLRAYETAYVSPSFFYGIKNLFK
jgi:hypothetical protein